MVELKYRQLGQGSVKGSQKVYYCAAPGDHEKYFDSIAFSLAACYPNISFWYSDDKGASGPGFSSEETKDLFFDLAQMNLFVIPVTRKFLTEKNRAREKEFSFATEHYIPVLPILEEPGLEELFNKTCGNLQCLSAAYEDDTALPFETKLKAYLDSVLLGDETLAKIRESFGGYIFLSYRKKDRAHAQEVMRLIHRDPSCRDAAVWYDEFLTPGEDFNDSIRQAFDRSSLFALVVTPHILEEGNYVMDQEYPMAVKAGRSVMPVVAVETDESALEKYYPGIPERWECSDDCLDMIAEKVRTELSLTVRDDPDHRYYIGLAYLSGVDLEADPEKAFSLISSAASDGVEDAYKKLVDMYRTGTGVERDYYEAAKWSQSYVNLLEKMMAADVQDESMKQRYVNACLNAGNNWEFVLEHKKALNAYEKSLSGKMSAGDMASYVYQMEACRSAALLAEKMHDLRLSERLCDRYFRASRYYSAAEIYKSRAEELAGLLAYRAGRWGEAIVHFDKGLELNEALAEKHPDLLYFKHLTAQFYQFLGSSYLRMGADIDDAGIDDYFEQALALYEEVADQKFDGTEEGRMMIIHSLGVISESKGDYDGVRRYARKAFDLALAKDQEENSLFSKRTVRDALQVFAESQELPGGDYKAAEFLLKGALSYSRDIVLMAGKPMGLSEGQLAWVSAQAQIPYYRKRMELLSNNGERVAAWKLKKELKALEKVKNPTPAETGLQKLLNPAEKQTGFVSDDTKGKDPAGNSLNEPQCHDPKMLAELAVRGEAGDIESLREAYDGYCLLAKQHDKDERYISERNRLEVILADACSERGLKGDIKMLERALLMDQALAVRLGYPECSQYLERADTERKQLAVMYWDAAAASKDAGDPAGKRVDLYLQAYEAYKALLEEEPDNAEWNRESDALAEQAAFDCWECGRTGERTRLIRAYELFNMIAEKHPEKKSCRTAINAIEDPLAFLYFGWGKTDPKFMELSLTLYRQLLKRDPENERLRKNVRIAEKRVARQQMIRFMKGSSAEKRQIENLLQGIVGKKVSMSDAANKI